jgi:hypothetical protein
VKLPGYCTECRRIRQVRVSGHGLALAGARGGTGQGICSACEEAEEKERVERYKRSRGQR